MTNQAEKNRMQTLDEITAKFVFVVLCFYKVYCTVLCKLIFRELYKLTKQSARRKIKENSEATRLIHDRAELLQ